MSAISGDHLVDWLKQCARGQLAQDHAEVLQSKIVAFAASHSAT